MKLAKRILGATTGASVRRLNRLRSTGEEIHHVVSKAAAKAFSGLPPPSDKDIERLAEDLARKVLHMALCDQAVTTDTSLTAVAEECVRGLAHV